MSRKDPRNVFAFKAVIVAAAMIAVSGPCPAQEIESEVLGAEMDFFVGLDFGYGLASPVCSSCGETGTQEGTTAKVFIGFGNGKNLLVGLQPSLWLDGWGMYDGDEESYYGEDDEILRANFMAFAAWYPWDRPGWFAKAGAGWSLFRASNRYAPPLKDPWGNDLPSLVIAEGPGLTAGGGYDFRVSKKLFLQLALSYFYGHLGPLTLNELTDLQEQNDLHLVELNFGLMFRPNNR